MTRKEWAETVATICDLWRVDLPATYADFWWPTIQGFTAPQVEDALRVYAGEPGGHRVPSGADIARMIDGDPTIDALTEIQEAVQKHGREHHPVLSPVAQAVVTAFGGWRAVCDDKAGSLMRHEFVARRIAQRAAARDYTKQIEAT